jgi:hypothetical protein
LDNLFLMFLLTVINSIIGDLTTGFIALIILVIIGLVIILLLKLFIVIIPAAIVAIIVYFLTGGDLFWTGIAFLVVAALSLISRL